MVPSISYGLASQKHCIFFSLKGLTSPDSRLTLGQVIAFSCRPIVWELMDCCAKIIPTCFAFLPATFQSMILPDKFFYTHLILGNHPTLGQFNSSCHQHAAQHFSRLIHVLLNGTSSSLRYQWHPTEPGR